MTTETSAKVMLRHALLLAMMTEDPDEAMRVLLGPVATVPGVLPAAQKPRGARNAG